MEELPSWKRGVVEECGHAGALRACKWDRILLPAVRQQPVEDPTIEGKQKPPRISTIHNAATRDAHPDNSSKPHEKPAHRPVRFSPRLQGDC
jgi:hypothetical protein